LVNAHEAVRDGLLQKYAPVLRYHDQEPLRADSPAIMTDAALPGRLGARLVSKSGDVIAAAAPSPGVDRLSLAYLGATYRGDGPRAAKTDSIVIASSDWKRDAQDMRSTHPGFADRVFAHAVQERGRGRVWLQYWLFYYFNDKGLKGLGDHDGDWETIQIGLDAAGRPELATYSQHTYGERREWKDVRKLDDDPDGPPLIWVALGSHACYFESGNYRIKRLPVPAPIFDYAKGKRVQVRPAIERLDDSDGWLRWPGSWGADGGPEGPLQHSQFKKPFSWHSSDRVDDKRTLRIGRTFLRRRPPEPTRLVARQDRDGVELEWELPPLHADDPSAPVRVVASVRRDDDRSPAVATSLPVTAPEGAVRLRLPPGSGPLEAALTTFDAGDRDGETARVSVSQPRAARRGARAAAPIRVLPAPQPARAAASLRLLVELTGDEDGAAARLDTAVAQTLDVDAAGAPWRVAPLFPRSGGELPARLRRFWKVSGRVPESPAYPFPGLAFDLARSLADATGFEVHPDLPSSAYAREEDGPGRGAAGARGRRGGGVVRPAGWALAKLGLDRARPLEPTLGEGVVIAQPDTGVSAHPALASVDRLRDADVIDGDDDSTDPLERRPWWPLATPGHGTSTASVIVGPGPGAPLGAAANATLVPIRTVSSVVQVLDGDVAVAIDYARRLGADVITMSLGGEGFFPALRESIAAAVEDGVIVMAAGGNHAWWVVAPARFRECLAVAATGPSDRPWSGTSPGPEIDWSAPGEAVWVAVTRRAGGQIEFGEEPHSGSSFAVAHSAGVAARWIAKHGRDTLRRNYPTGVQWAFRSLARSTARMPSRWDEERYGAGILNAQALLSERLPPAGAARPPAPLGPARRGRGRRPPPAVARLAPFTPGLPEAQLRERLGELLGVRGARLDAVLERFAGELAHNLAEDRSLHARVAPPPGARAGGRPRRADIASARERLASTASRELQEELAG
jgi:Subtilase family